MLCHGNAFADFTSPVLVYTARGSKSVAESKAGKAKSGPLSRSRPDSAASTQGWSANYDRVDETSHSRDLLLTSSNSPQNMTGTPRQQFEAEARRLEQNRIPYTLTKLPTSPNQ